jgi:RhtB (resistance to homoserine/threonine) family protein
MEYLALLGSLVVVDLLAAMSPGPNFVLITQTAAARTRRQAGAVVGGVLTANLVWCLAVMLGLAAVFDLSPWLFGLVKLLGGLYLLYLGVHLWRNAGGPTEMVGISSWSVARSYARGFVTNMTNPKSVVYFGSVFSVFLSPSSPDWVQVAAVCIVLANTVAWYGAVALLFSTAAVQRRYVALRSRIDRIAGAVLAVFGARLIVVRD